MTTYAAILAAHAAAARPPSSRSSRATNDCTYAELDARVARVASRLARAGVHRRRHRVVAARPMRIEALVLAFAANRLGAVHNPITTIAGAREIDFVLDQAESRVFIDAPDHDAVQQVDAADDPAPIAPPAPREVPRFLVYTSGSTAEPKGVLHSDATLLDECAAQSEYHGLTSRRGVRDAVARRARVGAHLRRAPAGLPRRHQRAARPVGPHRVPHGDRTRARHVLRRCDAVSRRASSITPTSTASICRRSGCSRAAVPTCRPT